MAFTPVSGSPLQYSNENNELASGYYLKFYAANTANAISMYTDDTGATSLIKCKLNPDGVPITNPIDNNSVFIPYVDQPFRYVIYKNETDADNDDTASAFINIAEVPQLGANLGTDAEINSTTSDTDVTDNRGLRTDNSWHIAQTGQYMSVTASGNTITLVSVNTAPISERVVGQQVRFRAEVTNTLPGVTLSVDGISGNTVTPTGVGLPPNYIRTDVDTVATWDGSDWVVSREVESGSNANGEFTRWEDGSMICRRTDTITIAITNASGAIFSATAFFGNLNYAQTFSAVPETTIDAFCATNGSFWIGNTTTTPTTSAFGSHDMFDSLSASARDYEVLQTATGKWY